MGILPRFFAFCFFALLLAAFVQCARRGTPSGGPKDEDPPVLIKSEPDTMSTNFTAKKIRLYFDELIRLNDIQNQLIVSPPLKYQPEVSPQGGTAKYVEVVLKDTLQDSTTYTLNFGESIEDNNEGNPSSFLTYVFSTGDYIDSLQINGIVGDAFNKDADEFISVMLYDIDTAYTDSTVFKKLPNYITNTLDSTIVFQLRNLKEGRYALIAIKDKNRNNLFDQDTDKIAFLEEPIDIPTDSSFRLTLFQEIPNFSMANPSYAASNKIIFGYRGLPDSMQISPLSQIPDTIKTTISREFDKDTLNFWFTPFEVDSLVFEVKNTAFGQIDTFTVKTRKLAADSLVISSSHRSKINFEDQFYIRSNIPITNVDTSTITILNQDSVKVGFGTELKLSENRIDINFEKEPNSTYFMSVLPGFLTDFFEQTNDTILYRLSTESFADLGNLRLNLEGVIAYPIILQLTDEKGETKREIIAEGPRSFEFNNIEPGIYLIRLIIDSNANKIWDTGNYLEKRQPEKVMYYPQTIEVRANWELEQTFTIGG
ncbi:MAG: Ig-like domain-containing protein [Flavobacteriaceae bacterium]